LLGKFGQAASRGTKYAPYAERFAEAVVPQTGTQLAKMGGSAAALAVPAEYARSLAERKGAGPGGQAVAEMIGGGLGGVAVPLSQSLVRGTRGGIETARRAIPGQFKAGAESLRGRVSDIAAEQGPLLEQEASALARGRVPSVAAQGAAERDIRSAQSRVQTQVQERAKQASAGEQQALQQVASQTVTDEQLGGFIQPKGRANVEALKGTRQTEAIQNIKNPAFEQARAREAKGQTIESFPASANQFKQTIAEIESQIDKTPEPFRSQLKARYASIRGKERPLTEGERRVEQFRAASIPGYQPKTVATEPLTLDEAEFLRRMLKDKDLSKVEGFPAVDAVRMNELGEKLLSAMKAYEPRIGEYIAEYESRSVPITKALAGKGERAIETEISKEPNILFSEDKKAVANYYLDGTEQRAKRLLDLIGGKSPEATQMVAGNIRSKVEKMNSEAIRDFVKKNEGLFKVFPEIRQSTERLAQAKESVEKTARMTTAQTKKLGEAIGVSSPTAKVTPESVGALKQDVDNFLDNIRTAAPKQVVADSKQFIEQLEKNGRLSTEQYRSLSKQIQDIEKSGLEQQEAAKKVRQVILGAAGFGGFYSIGRIGSGLLGL
jgi:chemotaxis regulatin CheY-phosphate phosphatase CheZ